ncbi:MAG: hypothetical protein HOW73_20255 [Polyangiaceae bacterium]|nr:hypothetical protein [Polyangiaceae bacterium]
MHKLGQIRVLLVGDSHFDESSRFDECVRVHDFIADEARRLDADLLIHSGDVFERKSTPTERRAVAVWLAKVADQCPVVMVRGNHDVVSDLSIFSRLRTRHPVIVEETAGVHVVRTKSGEVAIGCLAWPRKAELLAVSGAVGQEAEGLAQDALRNLLRGIGAELAEHSGPRIVLAHAMVSGSVTSTGQPLIGHDMELSLSDLALAKADLYALGHIHKGQQWEIAGAPVIYPGSPRRTAFGEIEPKGYQMLELDTAAGQGCTDDGDGSSWGVVENDLNETPCAAMFLAEDEWGPNAEGVQEFLVGWHGLDADPATLDGAEIRLRYKVASDQRDAARFAAARAREDLLSRGAVNVKVEEVVSVHARARAPEIAAAATLDVKLRAFWKSTGRAPGEAIEAQAIELLHQIESEERAA